MRIVVTTSALEGHFYPMVPLSWALRAAGHEVLVSAPANFTAAITGTGLYAAGYVPEIAFDDFMLRDRAGNPLTPPKDPRDRRESGGRAWGRLAAMQLEGTLALVDAYQPDLILSEPNEYAGSVAAASRGIPWIEHGWGIMGMPEFKPASEAELAPELAALGLPGLGEPDLRIDTCPPSLRREDVERALPMRYIPYNGPAVAPDWVGAERDRPRVLVTLGGVLPRHGKRDFRGMLREWTTALPGLGVEVVVAVADDLTAGWDPLPEGVRTAGWLPLNLTLPACDLVVHHGGVGTTLTTALAGLPQLLTPQLVDQFVNAQRITELGAGLNLQPEELSTAAVLDKCAELLADNTFAKCARGIAEENANRPAPADVVAQLEQFSHDHPRRQGKP